MKNVIYRHELSSTKKRKWDKAVETGNSMYDIWTNPHVDPEFRKMALMAITAPASDNYNYPTGGFTKLRNRTHTDVISIGSVYETKQPISSPKNLAQALENPQLAVEYGEAILFWLRETEISMVDAVDRGIETGYQYAIEDLLVALPEESELADELFTYHPINFLKEYYAIPDISPWAGVFSQSEWLMARNDMPKKYIIATTKALIGTAKLQEEGKLPMPATYDRKCISRALLIAITGEPFGAFRYNSIPAHSASEVFALVYDFLKSSTIPFCSEDIEKIAAKIDDEEERYTFCIRTMFNYPEYNAGLRCSDNVELLSWILNQAKSCDNSEAVSFINERLAKIRETQIVKEKDARKASAADTARQKAFEQLLVK